jgi:hypothetical protein
MKAKLIKTDKGNYILIDPTKGVYDKGYQIGNSIECDVHKLSKQNCDEIFGVINVEKLAKEDADLRFPNQGDEESWLARNSGVVWGFNKAMELNKDKVFSLEDIKKAIVWAHDKSTEGVYLSRLPVDEFIQSLQQPTEIEVEIEMEETIILKARSIQFSTQRAINAVKKEWFPKPKLDSEGCLTLKKI